jgi:hypothetical protein
MRNRIVVIGFLFTAFGFFSCEDDALKVQLKDDIAANVLSDLSSSTYVLTLEEAGNNFEAFKWTSPNFGFDAATTYTVQIAKAGNNFESPLTLATATSLSAATTVGALNNALLNLGLNTDEEANVEVRVRSIINDNVTAVYSTTIEFGVTPYATNFPPIYMIGDATGGWDWPLSVKIKSIAPSVYQTTAEFTKNGKFRFFSAQSWDDPNQYNWSTFESGSIDSNLTNGGDGDGNFIFAGETGWYTITADLKNKTLVMEATEKPALYMIGDAVQGWDLAKAVEMTRLEDGVFTATTTFTKDKIFRFFTAPDWGKGTISFTYFNGGQVDPLFVNMDDGDKNFKVIGETGEYTITVDLNNLTVVIGLGSPIYMIGDATGGWDLAKAVEVPSLGGGKYEVIATFTKDGIFRFFNTPAWDANPQYKWANFDGGSIDSKLESKGDGDDNFSFVGDTGSYKISVDVPGKSIVMVLQ